MHRSPKVSYLNIKMFCFLKRSTNVVSCTLGFEGTLLKAAVEQLKKKKEKEEETSLLPADFFLTLMGSMMRSRKDVEEDSWQWAA